MHIGRVRSVVMLSAATLLGGCDSSSPTAPAPAFAYVTGRVLDGGGAPVARARVTAGDQFLGPIEAATDDSGAYGLTVDARNTALAVTVDRDGFEPTRMIIGGPTGSLPRTTTADARLHAILRIDVGHEVPLEVLPDDPLCAVETTGATGRPCRRVRITSARGGRLGVSAVDTFGDYSAVGGIGIQRADMPPPSPALVIDVSPGSETVVEFVLLTYGGRSQSLLVTSSMLNE